MRKPSPVRELLVAVFAITLLALPGCVPGVESESIASAKLDEGTTDTPLTLTSGSSHFGGVTVGGNSYYLVEDLPTNPGGYEITVTGVMQVTAAGGGGTISVQLQTFLDSVWGSAICTASPCGENPNNFGPVLYFLVANTGTMAAQYHVVLTEF